MQLNYVTLNGTTAAGTGEVNGPTYQWVKPVPVAVTWTQASVITTPTWTKATTITAPTWIKIQ